MLFILQNCFYTVTGFLIIIETLRMYIILQKLVILLNKIFVYYNNNN